MRLPNYTPNLHVWPNNAIYFINLLQAMPYSCCMTDPKTPEWTWRYDQGELIRSSETPRPHLVTAVFCVAITPEGKILLARSVRGWGLLGGHVERGETLLQTLVRECNEEGGFAPAKPQPFAHKRFVTPRPVQRPDSTQFYPFPENYMLFYFASTNQEIGVPTDPKILQVASFAISEIEPLNMRDAPAATLGYQAFLDQSTK